MTEPWKSAEEEMADAGHSLDKIPESDHRTHLWGDGLLLFWQHHRRLPNPEELQAEMFDEWDDPVSFDEAEEILKILKG